MAVDEVVGVGRDPELVDQQRVQQGRRLGSEQMFLAAVDEQARSAYEARALKS